MADIINNPVKPIPGYENYFADRFGNVYHTKNDGMKWILGYDNGGYIAVKLGDCVLSVAKIIARLYVPNNDPENKTRVYRIDGQYTNNRADNLIWAKPSEDKEVYG